MICSNIDLVCILTMLASIRLLFMVHLCAIISLTSAIVGGNSAGKGQFPYDVSLRHKTLNLHFCGGALINKNYILTAAHCFFELEVRIEELCAVVNINRITDKGTRVDIIAKIFHPHFGVINPRPDVALLRTKEAIAFSKFVKPINLPTHEFIIPGTPAVIAGWGLIEV